MSTGDRFDRQDPFEQHVDFDESMERVKREGQQGPIGRLAEKLRSVLP